MIAEQNPYLVDQEPCDLDPAARGELASELTADDLDEVVGGLERTWVIPSPPDQHAML